MKNFSKYLVQTALAAGVVVFTGSASAQNQTGQQAVDDRGLQEIVVTAQRREESSQRAAVAITAVGGEQLVRAAVTDVTDLGRVAPSLQISTIGGSASQLYLRGVGNFTTNSSSDAAVAVAVDGVTIARSSAVQGMFYDLARVEVLKGPQGTLYGRNATGGQINVITNAPKIGQFEGYATAEYGNFDSVKLEAAVNAPMGENGAIRVSGFLSNRDGYLSDGTSDENIKAVRTQIAAEPTEGFSIRVGGDYAHVGGRGAGVTVRGLDRSRRIGSLDPRASPIIEAGYAPLAGAYLDNLEDMGTYQDNEYIGAFAQADIQTGIGTFTILPAYRRAEINQLYCVQQCLLNKMDDDQFTFEARLASDKGNALDYILGVYYLNETADEAFEPNRQFGTAYARYVNKTDSYAAFGQLAYHITDKFRVSAAGRYTIDDKASDIAATVTTVICPPPGSGRQCLGTPSIQPLTLVAPSYLFNANGNLIAAQPWGTSGAILSALESDRDLSGSFKKFTYRIGFEYDAGPSNLIYGGYETGYKAGGFFNSVDNPAFQPETIGAWTLGSKNRFLNNRLQFNVELFWWQYKDQQVSQFVLNSTGGREFATLNIGKTRIRGVDVDLLAKVTPTTTVRGIVQYLDTKRQNFIQRAPLAFGLPITGCDISVAGSDYVTDCSGQRAINAPEWTLSGGVEQVVNFAKNAKLILNADGRYQSWSWVGNEQLPSQRQKGYFMADLQARIELEVPNIFVAAFVNNVTDRNVAAFTSYQPAVGPQVTWDSLRPPRTYGLRAGIRF